MTVPKGRHPVDRGQAERVGEVETEAELECASAVAAFAGADPVVLVGETL